MEITRFLERLASGTPTPGGGSASAMAGALSASLIAMVAGLSSEKGRLKKKEIEGMRRKALAIQKRLYRAIDEDARSFDEVMKAFRLPKETERERSYRAKMIQKAYQRATATPQLVCEQAAQLLAYSKTLISRGNPNAISDAGVAAYLSNAAFEGGLLNIRINLLSIRDRSFRRNAKDFIRHSEKMRNRLITECLHLLKGVEG